MEITKKRLELVQNTKNQNYIMALKGIACIGILLGHFAGIVKYADSINIPVHVIVYLKLSPVLFNEEFWLQLFFIVSGYLLARSKIKTFKALIVKIIRRFLRLALPVFFSYCAIAAIGKTIGFSNAATGTLFENNWYQHVYGQHFNFLTVLFSPIDVLIKGNCILNSPYWVLRMMFFSSIIIYIYSYIRNLLKEKKHAGLIFLVVDSVLLFLSYRISNVVFVCMFGMNLFFLGKPIYDYLQKHCTRYKVIFMISTCIALICWIVHPHILFPVIFFSCIILVGEHIPHITNTITLFLGEISFGIYSFHWPLLCSVGSLFMLALVNRIALFPSICIAAVFCLGFSVLTAYLFHITLERLSSLIVNKVTAFLS